MHLDRDHTGVPSTHSKGTSGLYQFQALCGAAVGPPEEAAASDLAVICLEPGLLLPFPLQAALAVASSPIYPPQPGQQHQRTHLSLFPVAWMTGVSFLTNASARESSAWLWVLRDSENSQTRGGALFHMLENANEKQGTQGLAEGREVSECGTGQELGPMLSIGSLYYEV